VGAAAPLIEVISIPAAGEGEAVPSMARALADQAERTGSLTEAEAIPTEVAELAAVWHRLPDAVRAGIVAMVRASGGVRPGCATTDRGLPQGSIGRRHRRWQA
jgi:hypothetical protein